MDERTTTEQAIEALMAVSGINSQDNRAQYFLRESLRNLVRLAKAEQLMEMRADVARVVAPHHGVESSAFITRQ
ncbi:MAG: hypothetical protein H6R01_752 [Burkholderiaceae bacterium]|nr:hypothetical protein [Burkholderiaceae bacterium]